MAWERQLTKSLVSDERSSNRCLLGFFRPMVCCVAGNFTATLKTRELYNRTLIVMTSGEFWLSLSLFGAKEGQGLGVWQTMEGRRGSRLIGQRTTTLCGA